MRFSRAALIAALSLLTPALAEAQTVTPLNTLVTGATPPSGFTLQPFEFNCASACWPLTQIYDGTTRATVNANGGLNVNVLTSAASGNVFQANLFVPNGTVTNTSASTATTTQQFAASGSLSIFLVNYSFIADADDTANPTFQIVVGTGSNCATSQRALTGVLKATPGGGMVEGPIGVLNVSDAGDALCVKTTTTQLVSWRIGVVQQ
jgi:hypothetical protein